MYGREQKIKHFDEIIYVLSVQGSADFYFVKGLIVNILDCGAYSLLRNISNYASVQEHPEMISKWLEMAVSQYSFNCQH